MAGIVIGYDGTDVSKRALSRAAALVDGEPVTVVSVVNPMLSRGGPPWSDAEVREHARQLQEARELLAERGVAARVVEGYGDVAQTIADEAAEQRADLIVVGSHGKRLLERLAVGSVSTSLVHHAPCDVLVVR